MKKNNQNRHNAVNVIFEFNIGMQTRLLFSFLCVASFKNMPIFKIMFSVGLDWAHSMIGIPRIFLMEFNLTAPTKLRRLCISIWLLFANVTNYGLRWKNLLEFDAQISKPFYGSLLHNTHLNKVENNALAKFAQNLIVLRNMYYRNRKIRSFLQRFHTFTRYR